MSSTSGPQATQAVKLGELRMAEQLVKQRVDSATKATNERETLLIEEVRRNVQKDKNLDAVVKKVAALTDKVGAKTVAINEDHAKKAAVLTEEYKGRVELLNAATTQRKAAIQVELDKEKAALDALKTEIEHEIGKQSAGIKQKASTIRINLNQDLNRLNDQLYATILPSNLLAVVDQAPKIGEEGKFVAIEFKK